MCRSDFYLQARICFSETLSFVSGHGFSAIVEKSEQNWRVKFPRWGNFMLSESKSERYLSANNTFADILPISC